VLRARHERSVLEAAETVKYHQYQEAIKSREGLFQSLENTAGPLAILPTLLGKDETKLALPSFDALDTAGWRV